MHECPDKLFKEKFVYLAFYSENGIKFDLNVAFGHTLQAQEEGEQEKRRCKFFQLDQQNMKASLTKYEHIWFPESKIMEELGKKNLRINKKNQLCWTKVKSEKLINQVHDK